MSDGPFPAPGEAALAPDGSLLLGARRIPLPASVSPQARAFLAMPRMTFGERPPLADKEAWRRRVAAMDIGSEARAQQMLALVGDRARVETRTIAGVVVHVATPVEPQPSRREWLRITVHGGGLVYMGGSFARAEAALVALQTGCEAWSVDYRMPPDHPCPAAVDDVVEAYRAALGTHAPGRIVISGASAGGNLAAAAVLKARDLGLPLPGALGLFTPECDLTESGDSFATNLDVDNVLPGPLPEEIALYADGADLRHPYLSPLFGDFTPGYPPTQVQTGTRDLLLSNSVRMHRALRAGGVAAELHVWEAMPHGGFGPDAPESAEARREFDVFLERYLG
ncbi:MAG: alpha/beta hydrolase [Pseudomonadales bacterium]|nr:alpha/beta hydrolase [Pseudomonadales bacterium]